MCFPKHTRRCQISERQEGCRGDYAEKPVGIRHNPDIHRTPKSPIPISTLRVFWLDIFLNKHMYAVHVTVLTFSVTIMKKKTPVKQITNWIVFGDIQTATTTFVACLTRFRLISHPFENLHRIPTGPWGFISPHTHFIPIPTVSPMRIPVPTAALAEPISFFCGYIQASLCLANNNYYLIACRC